MFFLSVGFFLSSGSDDGSSIHAGRKSQLSDAIAEHRIPRNHFRFDPILRMLIVPDTVSCFYFDNPTQPTPIGSFMSSLVPFSAACPRTSMRSVVFECFFGSLLFFPSQEQKKKRKISLRFIVRRQTRPSSGHSPLADRPTGSRRVLDNVRAFGNEKKTIQKRNNSRIASTQRLSHFEPTVCQNGRDHLVRAVAQLDRLTLNPFDREGRARVKGVDR